MNVVATLVHTENTNLPANFEAVVQAMANAMFAARTIKGDKADTFRQTFPALVPVRWSAETMALLDSDPALVLPEGLSKEASNAITGVTTAAKEILSVGGPDAIVIERAAVKYAQDPAISWAPASFRKHMIGLVKQGMTAEKAIVSALATAKRKDFALAYLNGLKRAVNKAPEQIDGAGIGRREALTLHRLFAEASQVLAGLAELDDEPGEAPAEPAKPAKVRKTKAAK